jgi:CheY-like chemotaxis protein
MVEQVILHVEDDNASYVLLRDLFAELCPAICLRRTADGAKALMAIESSAVDPGVQLRLILLDVSLPAINGWEVLGRIRANESFRHLPVMIFTGVITEADRSRCATLDAECVEKPVDLQVLLLLVKKICERIERSGRMTCRPCFSTPWALFK